MCILDIQTQQIQEITKDDYILQYQLNDHNINSFLRELVYFTVNPPWTVRLSKI